MDILKMRTPASRRSNTSSNAAALLNSAGSNIISTGRITVSNFNKNIDYGIQPKGGSVMGRKRHDPYGQLQVSDLIVTTAKPQYDGLAVRYHVPDTASMHLYRIHGQVDQSKNKKSKTTYLSEIIDKAKKPGGSRPGPSDYKTEQALDYSKLHTTRRY